MTFSDEKAHMSTHFSVQCSVPFLHESLNAHMWRLISSTNKGIWGAINDVPNEFGRFQGEKF